MLSWGGCGIMFITYMKKIIFLGLFVLGVFFVSNGALAATVTTAATANIDSYSTVSVPNIVITEGAVNEIDKVAAHVWTVPTGYEFDTSFSVPNVTYTNGLAGPATASMTATTMTIDTTATSTSAGIITIGSTTPIKVKVTSSCPMAAAGNLTHTAGTITGITNGTTNFGTWTQINGCARKLIDYVTPSSSIIAPTEGERIAVGTTYVIHGTTIDAGTVTARQAEISFDGGSSWTLVIPTEYRQNGFDWEYQWVSGKIGLYHIVVRGTDGFNVEIPQSGVRVTVVTPVPAVTPEVTLTETPKAEMPAPQVEAPVVSEPVAPVAEVLPSVMLIRAEGDPRVYVIHRNMKRHIPSAAVFNAYGYKWQDVQVVLPDAVSAYKTANLVRQVGDDKVYIIENGKKKWIQTAEELTNAGYNWSEVVEVNATEFDFYLSQEAGAQVRIITDVLNVRDVPSLDGKIVTRIIQNSMYQIVSETEKWIKIKLPAGREGWVYGEYTERQ